MVSFNLKVISMGKVITKLKCVAPENIHKGYWKILGWGCQKPKSKNQVHKTSCVRGMDIFWNDTVSMYCDICSSLI